MSISDDVITKSAEEAEMKIEDHFAMCEKALAARKEAMLRELSQKAAIQSTLSVKLKVIAYILGR